MIQRYFPNGNSNYSSLIIKHVHPYSEGYLTILYYLRRCTIMISKYTCIGDILFQSLLHIHCNSLKACLQFNKWNILFFRCVLQYIHHRFWIYFIRIGKNKYLLFSNKSSWLSKIWSCCTETTVLFTHKTFPRQFTSLLCFYL